METLPGILIIKYYGRLIDFFYIWNTFINFKHIAMSHEKAKEQTKHKKEPTKSLKEKRAAKKAKKEEKNRM
jgi:hypothetical protein